MKSFVIISIAFIFMHTAVSFSQFTITSSVPADGAVNVPLSTTISFTFSAPLDTTMHYGESQLPISFIATDPLDSLVFGAISYSPDFQTVSFEIAHTPNTDFVWLAIGARSITGEILAKSYALNYTTSSTNGTRKVGGTVTFDGGDPVNAVVALLDRPPFGEDQNIALIGAVVTDSTGMFTANYVRDGVYWPIAAKDTDGDGELNPMGNDVVGFYDLTQDGEADSIVVSGSDLTGIDMTFRNLFIRVTASTYLDTARVIAGELAPDQELRGIGVHADPKGIDVGLDGTALIWAYQFYSHSLNLTAVVLVSSSFTLTDTTLTGFLSTEKLIPENFLDSDVAMSVAETNGGHNFEAQHNVVRRTLYGGNSWSKHFLDDSTKLIWVAEYEAIESDSSSLIYRVFVDMITGELITDVQELVFSVPLKYSLSQNYPNPFNPTTTIKYSIPINSKQYSVGSKQYQEYSIQSAVGSRQYQESSIQHQVSVSVKVYDIIGREVATLINKQRTPGKYSVTWDASGLSSGVYFYTLSAGKYVETKKMMLIR